jgi:hypothetical protein
MTRRELEQQIAEQTGESLTTIRRRGFSVVSPRQDHLEAELNDLPPQVYDWDARRATPLHR